MKKLLAIALLLLSSARAYAQCCLAGALEKTTSYSGVALDAGKMILMNCASACTYALPNPVQTPTWSVRVVAHGAGQVTIAPNGISMNGSTASIALVYGQSASISTNGTSNYYSFIENDTRPTGPNPYVDVTRFNVRSASGNLNGTASCSVGSTSFAFGSGLSGLINGDGVTVTNCGPPHSLSTPDAPVVTNAVANGLTSTGFVGAGVSGPTQYCFVVVAQTIAQGFTAKSPEACVSGPTSLGSSPVSITSCTRATNVITCTTAAHGLPVGCTTGTCGSVLLTGTSDSQYFNGWFPVATVPNTTSFTAETGNKVANGANASSTGGTTRWFASIHVTLPTAQTGYYKYQIYEGSSGGETWVATSLPVAPDAAADSTYGVYDYYGPTYSLPGTRPWYVPNTPPSVPTNDSLTTVVVSGGGTTNVVLASAAGATASGTAQFDNVPNVVVAQAFASGKRSKVRFPYTGGGYLMSSVMSGKDWEVYGSITVTDTIQYAGVLQGAPGGWHCPQFCIEGHIPIFVAGAKPGFLFGGGGSSQIRDLSFAVSGSSGNDYLYIYLSGGGIPALTIENCSFASGGNADIIGVALYAFAQAAPGGSAGIHIYKTLFSGGPDQVDGRSATPLIILKNYGEVDFDKVFFNRRGVYFKPNQAGIEVYFNMKYEIQGGIMPLLTVQNAYGNTIGGWIDVKNTILDTMAHALIANLTPPGYGLSAALTIEGTNGASPGISLVTGAPFASIRAMNGTGFAQLGQNFNVELHAGTTDYFGDQTIALIGTSKITAGQVANPSVAPTVALVTGSACRGNFPRAADYAYHVVFYDALGAFPTTGSTLRSPISSTVTPDGSTQCIQITMPTAPAGAVYWFPWIAIGPANANSPARPNGLFGCSALFSVSNTVATIAAYNGGCGNSPPTSNTTSLATLLASGFNGSINTSAETTQGQCFSSASPAACSSMIDGFVTIAASASTVVVNTTKVTANSNIQLTFDTTKSSQLGVTCNTTAQQPYVSAIVAGTSFTISVPSAFATNPGCIGFHVKN